MLWFSEKVYITYFLFHNFVDEFHEECHDETNTEMVIETIMEEQCTGKVIIAFRIKKKILNLECCDITSISNLQTVTHKLQHPKIATYPWIATFSCNQTKHTIKVGNICNFFSKRLTQKLQLFSWNLPFFCLFFSIFF